MTKQPPLAGRPVRGKQMLATMSQESTSASVEAAFGEVVGLIRARVGRPRGLPNKDL